MIRAHAQIVLFLQEPSPEMFKEQGQRLTWMREHVGGPRHGSGPKSVALEIQLLFHYCKNSLLVNKVLLNFNWVQVLKMTGLFS